MVPHTRKGRPCLIFLLMHYSSTVFKAENVERFRDHSALSLVKYIDLCVSLLLWISSNSDTIFCECLSGF